MRSKGAITAGAAGILIVGAIAGLIVGRQMSSGVVRQIGVYDTSQGVALLNEANQAQRRGEHDAAQTWSNEAVAYLFCAIMPLNHMGISSMSTIAPYVQRAESDFSHANASRHQKAVLQTLQTSLAPFMHKSYGNITDAELHGALSQVNRAISQP